MEKFGLFDIIEKLSPLKKTIETILPSVINATNSNSKKTQEEKPKRPLTAPALAYIRRHEELSKRIDDSNKNRRE